MKIYLLVLLTLLFISCSSQKQKELSLSYKEYKKLNYKHYFYTEQVSSYSDYYSHTKVYVKNDEVYKKEFEEFGLVNNIKFTENKNNLNSNKRVKKAKTLDELYKTCKNDILSKSENFNYIYLEFFSNKVLKHCTFTPKNCMDDCSIGINLIKIEKIK